MRIYLAGPIAHPDDNGKGWRDYIVEHVWPEDEIDWVNPLDRYSPEEYDALPGEEVVEDDKEAILDVDAILVGWTRVPSVGTPMEILYSHERDIPVHVWLEPEGSRASIDDRKLSPWLTYHADGIHQSAGSALQAIEEELNDE